MKDLQNLNEINEKYGSKADAQRDSSLPSDAKPLILVDKPHFERFFELKQEIKQKLLEDSIIDDFYNF